MKDKLYALLLTVSLVSASCFVAGFGSHDEDLTTPQVHRLTPKPPSLFYSPFKTAPLEVARIFGRAPGCADASTDLIQAVADASVKAGVDPRIAAAAVSVESSCNQYAVSTRGALGYMQVRVVSWKGTYDFAGDVNLLNREDNLRVGSEIMAGLIQRYGVVQGVQFYNGAGVDCPTCDGGYSNKILQLAGRK